MAHVALIHQAKMRNALSASSESYGIKRSPSNRREASSAAQCLSHLCLSEHLSDIYFTFSDDESVKLPAHKFVLSMRSAVFETMFYGSLSEEGEYVALKDVNPEVMRTVLRYVYSDNPDLDGKNVLPCLYTAKKYQFLGLVELCSDFLEKNIDVKNVCQIIEQAIFYEMEPLKERCLSFITKNATKVLSSPGFINLSHATLLNILKSNELECDEIYIFKATMKWAEHKCESKSGQNIRDQLGEVLYQIRFPIIPMEKFARVVTPSGILTNEEIVMLYQFTATKGSTPLGKFRQEERNGAQITLNLRKLKYSQQHMSTSDCFSLNIQYNNSSRQLQYLEPKIDLCSKSVRLKSVTGTFVRNVKGITISGVKRRDYETNGDKIIFMNPIDMSDNINVQFHSRKEQNGYYYSGCLEGNNTTYRCNISEKVKGQDIIITSIPDGLETISFV